MRPVKFFRRPESYPVIKAATDTFRQAARSGNLVLQPDQHLGIILNIHELIDIAKLANPDGNVVLLYSIDTSGKLTASFLGADATGDITPTHYQDGREGEETWENNTSNARNGKPPVQIDMTDDDFNEYMPEPVTNAAKAGSDEKAGTVGDEMKIADGETLGGDGDIMIQALEPYDTIKIKTKQFAEYIKKVGTGGFASFAEMPLGIYFTTTELENISAVASNAVAPGVLMLYGLKTADDPTTMTVSFVAADDANPGRIQVHNYHKKDGSKGEETWKKFADCKISGNVKEYLEKENPLPFI